MKNKKLFAILTLVCFMFTLMPVAAFAAATPATDVVELQAYDDVTPVGSASDKVTVEAPNKVEASVEDASGSNVTSDYAFYVVNKDGKGVYATTGTAIYVKAEGTYTVYAVKATAAVVEIINTVTMYPNEMVELIETKYVADIADASATLKVKNATDEYTITNIAVSGASTTGSPITGITDMAADNGYTEVTVTGKVLANGSAAKYADLKITSNGVKIVDADEETDNRGRFEFKLAAANAGEFTVKIECGDADYLLDVTVAPDAAGQITTIAQPANPVDVRTNAYETGIAFKLYDVNGNKVTTDSALRAGYEYKVIVEKQPADSDVTGLSLMYIASKDIWTLTGDTLDEEGDYTFAVVMKNGSTAKASVTVKEFDDDAVAGLKVTYDRATVGLGQTANIDKFYLVDKNGVQQNVTTTLADFAVNGLKDGSFNASTLAVTATSNKDYIGSVITVYAVYGDYTASADLKVVAGVDSFAFTKTTAEIGVNSTLTATVVDYAGNKITLPGAVVAGYPKVVILEKPENAVVSATAAFNTLKDGLNINFVASAAGEYKIQVIAQYGASAPYSYVSGITTVTVGAQEGTFQDVIVMSIGANTMVKNSATVAMPAAPEIVDSRTMVPARAGLEAFGATVVWNEADQTVTAELNGVKVVMTIGEKAYTVNGKVVVGDAAPYITAASTMVPVSFFTNAFGITATPIYDANGVCDVLFTK